MAGTSFHPTCNPFLADEVLLGFKAAKKIGPPGSLPEFEAIEPDSGCQL
jgi:hypothetical protein